MSFISTQSTINFGDQTSSTANMNTSVTLNLGAEDTVNIGTTIGNVNITSGTGDVNITGADDVNIKAGIGSSTNGNYININGLPLLFSSSNTGTFASITSLNTSNESSNFYILPFQVNQPFIIQWGYKFAPPGTGTNNNPTIVTFPIAFSITPYVFAQQYGSSSATNNNIVVTDFTYENNTCTKVSIDSAYNNQAKYPIAWLALGLFTRIN